MRLGGTLILGTVALGTLCLAMAPALIAAEPPSAAARQGYQVLERSCFKCHGEGIQLSSLDLRTRDLALRGGEHGAAVVPGKPEQSRLYRLIAGLDQPQMPPTGRLADREIEAVRAWIAAGAPYPGGTGQAKDGDWWAFRTVRRPPVPEVDEPAWNRNPVDRFLLAKMRAEGVQPSPRADRRTLIRRATFDLHGLPPTYEEVEAFVNDPAPDAYPRLIDRLLASPRYGERWARHWLDLSRFAESEGFKSDEFRPTAWRYRDYVIDSFNADKPYDRFIREQIAGDELSPDDPWSLVATGFNRHWADESNARNLRLRRQEILNDITDTVSSVMLGLTTGCARCHDHKYDPIPQRDYYRLQAFFAGIEPRAELPLVPRDVLARHRGQLAEWQAATRETREKLAALEAPYREKLMKDKRMPFPEEVQVAIDTSAAERTALQWQLYRSVLPQIELKPDDVAKAMEGDDKAAWESLRGELEQHASIRPADLPTGIGITDIGSEAPETHVLGGGSYDSPEERVDPGFLSAFDPRDAAIVPRDDLNSTGRRTVLAYWLTSPRNPLTARVMVNRIWQYHFGTGIVPTASDFGRAGALPTHPELLDWLSSQFVANGWRMKAIHRLIMTSEAYQQTSDFREEAAEADPDNRLVWRFNRRRLEGEAVRDAALAASGLLNLKMAGPSVFPELPPGATGAWPVTQDEAERSRRSVYVFVKRNQRYPLFEAFDFPDTHEPCARRTVTNTAPQALMLFNSALTLKWAQALAGRVLAASETSDQWPAQAYRLVLQRDPDAEEQSLALEFLRTQTERLRARATDPKGLALPAVDALPEGDDPAVAAALVDLCHALMNANEFVYVE
jgi:mono/diheme cytochrome c family protein